MKKIQNSNVNTDLEKKNNNVCLPQLPQVLNLPKIKSQTPRDNLSACCSLKQVFKNEENIYSFVINQSTTKQSFESQNLYFHVFGRCDSSEKRKKIDKKFVDLIKWKNDWQIKDIQPYSLDCFFPVFFRLLVEC